MSRIMSVVAVGCAIVLFSGCANGAGREIAKGAVRGASHGVIDKRIDGDVGQGAAHGALSSTHSVRDKNKAERRAAKEKSE